MARLSTSWRFVLPGFLGLLAASPAFSDTSVKPYLKAVGSRYRVTPLLSCGDTVPWTSDPSLRYQMVGIPDGLGLYPNRDGTLTLIMNHELGNTTLTQPVVGGPIQRGAFISRWILERDGEVLSGERAFDTIYIEEAFFGPIAESGNTTPAMGRFCSGFLADRGVGFDQPIWLSGEEVQPNAAGISASFDPRGSMAFAIFDHQAHALPKLGRFSRENVLVMRETGQRTIIITQEDGSRMPDNQLYMYVGQKDRRPGAGVLSRNGLDNGKLYTFVSTIPGVTSEATFKAGTISGEWVELPDAEHLSAADLEAAAQRSGAFAFVKIEDGSFSAKRNSEFYFVTTGDSIDPAINRYGRLYSLRLDQEDPLGAAALHIVYNADSVIADGGDIAISPDNVAVNRNHLMVCEDGHDSSRPILAQKGREGRIWRFDLMGGSWLDRIDPSSATPVAELNPPGRDGVTMGPGIWETSGIIDTSRSLRGGRETWLVVVQAHPPTAAPAPGTAEDGQLLLLTSNDPERDADQDEDADEE
jgi:hypothetical protein